MSDNQVTSSPQTTKDAKNGRAPLSVDYKPKPYNNTYKEYRSTSNTSKYKPYVPTQLEFKGNVEYKLTKDNYYPLKHWKSQSMKDPLSSKQSNVDTTNKKVPVVPRKAITPPHPPQKPTATPPPPNPSTSEPTLPISTILPLQEFNPENKYPPEVIACVQAYIMAHRNASNKVTPTPEPFFAPPNSKYLPPEVEALLSAYYSLHSVQ